MYANRDIYEGTFYKNGFKNEGNYTWNYTSKKYDGTFYKNKLKNGTLYQ